LLLLLYKLTFDDFHREMWRWFERILREEGKMLPRASGENQDRDEREGKEALEPAEVEERELSLPDVIRSEVNLLVLPFFALWDKDVRRKTETEYRAVITKGARRLEIYWNVSANPKYGYPGPFDKKVHRAIEQIISELPLPIRNPIPLGSLNNLAKRMGIPKAGGREYRKIKEALRRIVATTVVSKGIFYCKGTKEWVEDEFHLYERVIFKGMRLPNGEIADTNYLYLNSWYLENINARYVKPIDWRYYNSLGTPIAQRLYELLSIKFYGMMAQGGSCISYRYSTLCDLLPVARQKYLSFARKSLDPAHRKLKETGFLESWSWERIPGERRDWIIRYYPGEKAKEEIRRFQEYYEPPRPVLELPKPEEEKEPLAEDQAELVEKLVKLNVSEKVAKELVRTCDRELIERWTEAIHYTNAKDKAAYLVKAIKENWALPEEYLKALEEKKREEELKRLRLEEERKRKEAAERRRRETEELRRIYESLPAEMRRKVDEEAMKRLPSFMRDRIRRGESSPVLEVSLEGARKEVIREWIESGKLDRNVV